jgi:glyoxylase-like metal-dependent hydrolase (beta-lactamase superfamily II)
MVLRPNRLPRTAAATLFAAALLGAAASAAAGTVDRLYGINCGYAHAADQSLWSPGVNAGVPIDFSDNCYLAHHTSEGYLLWDTGITDRLAGLAEGVTIPALRQTWRRAQTLAAALAALGLRQADIRYVALSHVHPDHAGNVDAFPDATLIIQKAEWDYAMSLPQRPFNPDRKVQLIAGDKDLFGDGSTVIISTPGHTPGHQSLLLRLPKTGTVLLTGDAVHFQANWDSRRVPSFNTDKDQTIVSMQRIAEFLAREQAKLWINHDKPSSDARRRAPEFYD